ncbi:hypothetical protein FSW04_13955 [Baekduia soli]|uniref:Uncharacterized protein n=1 Tax=Baekduia soli TaxID=496014 RepID=A0A5B8U649_9ACTN|nr:hypothetical protein [Baekduia soli]QEC48563.1 hypothetical protein FSW04_13955 [Baekduia soli]
MQFASRRCAARELCPQLVVYKRPIGNDQHLSPQRAPRLTARIGRLAKRAPGVGIACHRLPHERSANGRNQQRQASKRIDQSTQDSRDTDHSSNAERYMEGVALVANGIAHINPPLQGSPCGYGRLAGSSRPADV